MGSKRIVFLFLLIFSVIFLRKDHLFEHSATSLKQKRYKCEIITSNNHNDKDWLFNDEGGPAQVLNYRTVRSLHFIKNISFILGGLIVCHTCLKYNFHISNRAYARRTKLMLFPHHVFW